MSFTVVVSEEAATQARRIDDWWRLNRERASSLFADELAAALTLISDSPRVGRLYRRSQLAGIRRLQLRESRFHVYYVVDTSERLVTVLSVWSSLREPPSW